jgi:protein-S-isoprenylcysteine O-methyltransferase Ste14
MSRRAVARIAFLLQVVYVALTFGWRSWLQLRTTGDTGFRLSRANPIEARAASALMVGGAVTGLVGAATATRADGRRAGSARLLGVAAIAAGLVATYRAQLDMGASWRIGVDTDERTELVTRGLFRVSRNPIFSSMALVALGSTVAAPSAAAVSGATMLVTGLELQTRMVEEPYLRDTHGDAYDAYAARTGRFVPRLGVTRSG